MILDELVAWRTAACGGGKWPDLEQQPLTLRVHPDVVPAVERALEAAERGGPWDLGGHILVEADPTLHPDHFDVILR